MVIAELAGTMVEPSTDSIDEPGRVKVIDRLRQIELGFIGGDLAPSFVVDNLSR
jgi:hypothetical protein